MLLFAPLLAFLFSACAGRRIKSGVPHTIAIGLSFILSLVLFYIIFNAEEVHYQWRWFIVGEHEFKIGLLLNNLTVLMLVLVSAIALPVHIYSIAYMKGDSGIHRYWMYLSLFCFAMLLLVLADNLLLMYIGWELVGFVSYLLIGYWFTRDAAVEANKKAFLVNRIGDIGFLIGLAILYVQFGTLDIPALFGKDGLVSGSFIETDIWKAGSRELPSQWLSIAGICFFIGAMAKSAQYPFHAWLPDAMEGPTSVSSLIHAATMVAAGVFMLVRIHPLLNEFVFLCITVVGAFTAFMAATVALTQQDIKKVLAFSTISQLGFMMVAIGIGQYGAAVFHLVTHAFFKCLLFLCAGAVIHEMQHIKSHHKLDFDVQDMRNMGGLRKEMPFTFVVTLIAALALAGLPLTAGYLSKDALLIYSFEWSDRYEIYWKIIPLSLLCSSAMTAFYIARLVFKVFYGHSNLRSKFGLRADFHDVGAIMRYPMFFLAVCCLFPVFAKNPLLFEDTWLLNGFEIQESLQRVNIYHTVIPAGVNALSIVVIFIAWRWYARLRYPLGEKGVFYRFSEKQWYTNTVYRYMITKPVYKLAGLIVWFDQSILDKLIDAIASFSKALAKVAFLFDRKVVDGVVNGTGKLALFLGNVLRGSKGGRIQHYMFSMFVILLVFLLLSLYHQL